MKRVRLVSAKRLRDCPTTVPPLFQTPKAWIEELSIRGENANISLPCSALRKKVSCDDSGEIYLQGGQKVLPDSGWKDSRDSLDCKNAGYDKQNRDDQRVLLKSIKPRQIYGTCLTEREGADKRREGRLRRYQES